MRVPARSDAKHSGTLGAAREIGGTLEKIAWNAACLGGNSPPHGKRALHGSSSWSDVPANAPLERRSNLSEPPGCPLAKRLKHLPHAALLGAASLVLIVLAVRVAVHQLPWFGPWLADALRSVVGVPAVTWLEELSADIEDTSQRLFREHSKPRSLEQAQPGLDQAGPEVARAGSAVPPAAESAEPAFHPRDVGPLHPQLAAKSDGEWRAVVDPARPEDPALLFATLIHPDRLRPWAEVFVVAADLSMLRLHAVAGTVEPEAMTAEGRAHQRRGLIPREQHGRLLAAFNGGFMTKHGHHGMHVGGVTLVPPQARLCTVLGLSDAVRVGSWRSLAGEAQRAEREGQLLFWRQAAPCLFEGGVINPLLRDENVRNWGATIDGKVVIRRSAVGLDSSRGVLFVGVSNDTTATAIANAMHHAGASDVAQLDVNWSYPKFLLFPVDAAGERHAKGLFEGFVFRDDEYVRRPATRDFFYLVRRAPP